MFIQRCNKLCERSVKNIMISIFKSIGCSILFSNYVQALREGICYKGYQIETLPE